MLKKAIILIVLILFAGTVFLFAVKDNKPEQVIRLHVKANSDTTEDQSLKLKVRDEVISILNPVLEKAKNINEARTIIKEIIPQIKAGAEETIRDNGYTYAVNVSLGNREFPTRIYDGKKYAQGVYEALMVEIGKADGANWWCIAYPGLCYATLDNKQTNANVKPQKRSIFQVIRGWFR